MRTLRLRKLLGAAALILAPLAAGAAQAGELVPAHAHRIELRDVAGVAYYTVGTNGQYLVVAVVGSGPDATPVRVSADLLPGQTFTIAVPGAVGERDEVIEIARHGNVLAISPTLVASTD